MRRIGRVGESGEARRLDAGAGEASAFPTPALRTDPPHEGEGVSALYDGAVTHQRFAPRRHRLRYRLFQILFDLDELPALDRRLKLFGYNRPGLFSFHDRDHGDGQARPLRPYVERRLAEAGIGFDGGAIRLLCMPRVLGFVFNPLSIYFCHRRSGELAAVLYEVNNTFGERHSYLMAAEARDGEVRQACAKRFFVSPFMGMDMTYDFRLTEPGESIATVVEGRDLEGQRLITAAFAGRRKPMTDAALASAFLSHPLMTLKVVGAIHWEALKLVSKGLALRRKPAPPTDAVTA